MHYVLHSVKETSDTEYFLKDNQVETTLFQYHFYPIMKLTI